MRSRRHFTTRVVGLVLLLLLLLPAIKERNWVKSFRSGLRRVILAPDALHSLSSPLSALDGIRWEGLGCDAGVIEVR